MQQLPLHVRWRIAKQAVLIGLLDYIFSEGSAGYKLLNKGMHKASNRVAKPTDARPKSAQVVLETKIKEQAYRIKNRLNVTLTKSECKGEKHCSSTPNLPLPIVPKPRLTDYVVEEHTTPKTNEAKRHWSSLPLDQKKAIASSPVRLSKLKQTAGYQTHWDLRIRIPGTQKYVSFATKKARFPEEGEKFMFVQTTSGHGYHPKNPEVIPDGYGAGISKIAYEGKALVWTGAGDNFHIFMDCHPRPFAMIPAFDSENRWDTVLMFQLKKRPVAWEDRPWKMVDLSGDDTSRLSKLEDLIQDENYVMERKYDGGFYWLIISPPKDKYHDYPQVALVSRKPKIEDGKTVEIPGGIEGLDKSWNVVHIKFANIPRKYYEDGSTVLAVEVYAASNYGDWNEPHDYVTSVLNSHPVVSEQLQRKYGRLRLKVLDIKSINGKNVLYAPYESKRPQIDLIHTECFYVDDDTGQVVRTLHVPKSAIQEGTKRELLNKEFNREFGEGVVFKPRFQEGPMVVYKRKKIETWDLRIVSIEPVEPTSESSKFLSHGKPAAAGKFVLENGQPVKITTDKMKMDAWEHPEEFIGKVAEVKGMSRSSETRKIRAPVLIRVREDK